MRAASNIQSIDIDTIRKSGTQSRKRLDEKTVRDIRDGIRDSSQVEPIVLFFDGADHWIADGHHRVEAHIKEGRVVIQAEVRHGSKDEALRYNVQSSAEALQTRWTNDDKRNAVTMLLQSYGCEEVSRARAEEIAAMAKCHTALVYKVAGEIKAAANDVARRTSKPIPPMQPPVAQAVTAPVVRESQADVQREPAKTANQDFAVEEKPEENQRVKARNARSDVAERKARDEKIAAMVTRGASQKRSQIASECPPRQ